MWISELFHFNATLHNLVFVTARKFNGSVLSLVNTDCGEIDFCLLGSYTYVVIPV